ncbi:hypothetical protein Y032_0157g3160 [Ancylostoma ceylanicum]|uniref:Uncharacterized protein n=1 Tax=Ancylostoma ceylanicum TaxID=53326 RepID=A0A016SZ02_9BILA|nr:hypothetical protein Y032_0157g3160 [Ancylostoma ceylanicum]
MYIKHSNTYDNFFSKIWATRVGAKFKQWQAPVNEVIERLANDVMMGIQALKESNLLNSLFIEKLVIHVTIQRKTTKSPP